MKIAIQKLVGDLGETWMVEIPVTNDILHSKDPVVGIKASAAAALRVMDDRLYDLNKRLLAGNAQAQKLTPEAKLALGQVIEIMYGRRQGGPNAAPEIERPGDPALASKVEAGLEAALEAVDGGRA